MQDHEVLRHGPIRGRPRSLPSLEHSGVTSSSRKSPRWRAIRAAVNRESLIVDGLQALSCSAQRSHSAAASATVAPVAAMPGNSSARPREHVVQHASAVRFVK